MKDKIGLVIADINPMSKLTTLLLILFGAQLLSSCGLGILPNDLVVKDSNAVRTHQTTNPQLAPYVTAFEEVAKVETGNKNFKVVDIPVNYGDPGDQFQGVCFEYLSSGKKEIIVRESWWNSASDTYRKSLIYHELGHCALGREHDTETLNYGGVTYKASMMNPIIIQPGNYQKYESEYHKELFTYNKNFLILALEAIFGSQSS